MKIMGLFIGLCSGMAGAAVVYQEDFNGAPAAATPVVNAGWNAYYGASASSFYPHDGDYRSAPYIRAENNYLLDNDPGGGERTARHSGTKIKFICTDEISSANADLSGLLQVRFDLARQAGVRVAVQLDHRTDWYLSESVFYSSGRFETKTLAVSSASWLAFAFEPGVRMEIGSPAELPSSGTVTGIGFFYQISEDGRVGDAGDFALDHVLVQTGSDQAAVSESSSGFRWTQIPSGAFSMGAQPGADVFKQGERGVYSGPDWDEAPVHPVTISTDYKMSVKEVSNADYERFDPGHAVLRGSSGDDDPVRMVTWGEAVAFCEWLSQQTGKPCRLPTEAEWEYAAGLADAVHLEGMTNAISEWCSDWWGVYPDDACLNPGGMTTGSVRVIRGYSVTDRMGSIPADRSAFVGFRIVQGALPPDSSYRENEPGAAFANVRQTAKTWTPVSETDPVFSGGTDFFRRDMILSDVLYWDRHHVPSLTWCDNGDLLVTAFTAPNDGSAQIAVLLSRLREGSGQWDAPACFFIAPDHSVNSAVLWHAPDGELHHYNSLSGPEFHGGFAVTKRTSADQGATWSPATVVHDRNKLAFRVWAQIDLVQLNDGTWIFPSDAGGHNEDGTNLFESDDSGDSWTLVNRYKWNADQYAQDGATAGWIAGIHASVVELKNGDLLAFGRDSNINGFSPFSQSSDGGKTWTYRASPFPPIRSGQRAIIKRLNEGPLLLVSYTDLTASYSDGTSKGMEIVDRAGDRQTVYGLFSSLSFDDGQTWQNRKLVPIDPAGDLYTVGNSAERGGYLSGVQTPDNMIHIVTSRQYYQFNLAWLKAPMPAK
jgi:formylglycine-generating enzyme required for sulfatase activity